MIASIWTGAPLEIVRIIRHHPPAALPERIGDAIAIEVDPIDSTFLLILEIAGAIHPNWIEHLL